MAAVFLEGVHKVVQDEMPIPQPGPRDVLVKMKAVGVCGSDVHCYEHGRIGGFVVREPLVLGHECAGEVVDVGRDVTTLRPGDAVALEPGIPCRHCAFCLSGRYNLCRDVVFMGTPPHHGALREYVTSPEDFAYKLSAGVSMEVGATLEPLAVDMHACTMVDVKPGESVTVPGAGPIGLLAVSAASAAGAAHITAVDMVRMRLEFAGKMGADRAVDADQTDVSEELENSADVVLDCAGVEQTLSESLKVARPGGRVGWIGMASNTATVPLIEAQAKELSIVRVFRYANVYGRAVKLLASGQIDTEPLITHKFRFPEVKEALKFASENKEIALKTMVVFE